MKKLVYICSPCRGDYEKNIDNAATYSRAAFTRGYIPITPHLYFTHFMDDTNDKERSMAMAAGSQLLLMCSEVWVFGLDHPSEGMQAEIALAIRHGLPIIDGDEILSGKKKPKDRYVLKIDLHKFYGTTKQEMIEKLAEQKIPKRRDELDARNYCIDAIAKALNIPPHVLIGGEEALTIAIASARRCDK